MRVTIWALALSTLGARSIPAADAPAAKTNRMLVYHAWASPSETAAMDALVALFKAKYPDVATSSQLVAGGGDPKKLFPILNRLVAAKSAPEAFQAHAGYGAQPFFEAGLLSPIDGLWSSEGLDRAIPPLIRAMSDIKGHAYAVPLGVHRMNVIWYNKPLLDRHGVDPRTLTTWEAFFKAADVLRAHGVAAPIEMGDSWTATIVFQGIVASQGIGVYESWINGKITASDDPRLLKALQVFGQYLTYVNADHATLAWGKALQRFIDGEAAFYTMGDWSNGEFRVAGKKFDRDYGAMPVPGTKGMYAVTVDTFLRPQDVVNTANSDRWLKLAASREGQDAFNVLKGSVPARSDADIARYDPYQKSAIADLKAARSIYPSADEAMPDAYRLALIDVLAKFAADRDAKKAAELLARTSETIAAKYTRVWSLR